MHHDAQPVERRDDGPVAQPVERRDDELTDDLIRKRARDLVVALGAPRAAKQLGTNRLTVLALAAGAAVRPGSFALIRERQRCRGA